MFPKRTSTFPVPPLFCFVFIAQAGLELAAKLRMALNSQPSCLTSLVPSTLSSQLPSLNMRGPVPMRPAHSTVRTDWPGRQEPCPQRQAAGVRRRCAQVDRRRAGCGGAPGLGLAAASHGGLSSDLQVLIQGQEGGHDDPATQHPRSSPTPSRRGAC